jgi:hypothetical protein
MFGSKTILMLALVTMAVASLCPAVIVQTVYWNPATATNSGRTANITVPGYWYTDVSGTIPVYADSSTTSTYVKNLLTMADPNTAFIAQPIGVNNYGMALKDQTITTAGSSMTVTAPFTFISTSYCPTGQAPASDANFPLMQNFNYVMEVGDLGGSGTSGVVWTFNDLKFQGTWRAFRPTLARIAGKMTCTGETRFSIRSGQTLFFDAEIDASAQTTLRKQFYERDTASVNSGKIELTNGNNKFYGTWILDATVQGDTAGCFGDSDFQINGPGTPLRNTDRRSGALRVNASGAVSASAKITIDGTGDPCTGLTPFTIASPQCPGAKIYVATAAAPMTIRELWVNGVQKPAGTYTVGTANPWILTGSGSIVVTNTATQNLTLAATADGVADANIKTFPPVGLTKAYAQGYAVKIKAVTPYVVGSKSYAFSNWTTTGGTLGSTSLASTTITIPTGSNVTVTANYVFAATDPTPADGATGVATTATLGWTPVGGTRQDIYFGTDPANLPVLLSNQSGTLNTANPGTLEDTRTYYWRVSTDNKPGSLWSFSTVQMRPYNPIPAVGATGIDIHNPKLKWTQGQASPSSWDVYVGTNSAAMAKIATMTAPYDANGVSAGDPLAVNKTYYWRVDEKPVPSGAVSTGVVWNFATRSPICTNPMMEDFNGDCRITFADFAVIANDWGK